MGWSLLGGLGCLNGWSVFWGGFGGILSVFWGDVWAFCGLKGRSGFGGALGSLFFGGVKGLI